MLKIKQFPVYWRLMRADKPVGTLLLLWPTLWALFSAAGSLPSLTLLVAFAAGVFFMRSVGCVVNDYADRHFDGAVERTKNRPFASGEVSLREALALCVLLLIFAAFCLPFIGLNAALMALPALFLAFTYPFTKRFFPVPQLYLGVAFSFGIPMAFTAVLGFVPLHAWLLFAANLLWTLGYDTYYAMVDKNDDLVIGIKTSAITFGRFDAEIAAAAHALFWLLMLVFGLVTHLTWPFFMALAVVFFMLFWQYQLAKTRVRASCLRAFLSNSHVGMVLWLGLWLGLW